MQTDTKTSVERYLAWGLCIIPIQYKSKKPAVYWEKYQKHKPGEDELGKWFSNQLNIAVVCGSISDNLVVLDFDDIELYIGFCSFWSQQYGKKPEEMTPIVQTGSGGYHVYLKISQLPPLYHPTKDNRSYIPDIQSEGGYVLVPPSIHPSGNPYRFLNDIQDIYRVDSLSSISIDIPATRVANSADHEGPIESGGRNNTLTSMAGAMRRRGVSEQAIFAALLTENDMRCIPPLPRSDIAAIARSVSRYEPQGPDRTPRDNGNRGWPEDAHYTDMGNASRFVADHGDMIRYCNVWGKWLVWNDQRWVKDSIDLIVSKAKGTVRSMYSKSGDIEDMADRKKAIGWALQSESESRVKSMISMATSENDIPIEPSKLDQNPWLMNVCNGTLDLRTGELQNHRKEEFITKQAQITYDEDAECPQWLSFMDRIFSGQQQLIRFVQRALGYSLTGDNSEQIMFICFGLGANGKSTLLELIRFLLGDYALHTPFTTFLARDNEVVRNDLARLVGSRFVSSVELRSGQRLDEVVVKQVTGSDTIAARFLYREYFEFTPVFKLWLAANHKPVIRGVDEAIWRRIALIPFDVTIPKIERDKELPLKLQVEASGIFSWVVKGCLSWQEIGLNPPEQVSAATEAYRTEMDTIGGFIADRCLMKTGARALARDLYESYCDWCQENGEKAIDPRWFGRNLSDRGYKQGPKATGGQRTWMDLELVDSRGIKNPEFSFEGHETSKV